MHGVYEATLELSLNQVATGIFATSLLRVSAYFMSIMVTPLVPCVVDSAADL